MIWRAPRALWRLLSFVAFTLVGVLICALVFPFVDTRRRMRIVGWYCARMLGLLGVGLRSTGHPHAAPVLLAANHISWLDILAINAVHPARFVSKADVRRWPLLGWMVACGGTLFIERERKRDALRVVHQVAQALRDGETLAVFPEGTTSDGHSLLPFHANLLQAAIATQAPVQPIALRFSDAHAAVSEAAMFVGETTLVESVLQVLWADRMVAHVHLLAAEPTHEVDRRDLADRLRERVAASLGA